MSTLALLHFWKMDIVTAALKGLVLELLTLLSEVISVTCTMVMKIFPLNNQKRVQCWELWNIQQVRINLIHVYMGNGIPLASFKWIHAENLEKPHAGLGYS